MLLTQAVLQREVDRLKTRVQRLPPDDLVDPRWVGAQVQDINDGKLTEDTLAQYKSLIDVWTGDEAISSLRDDISDLSMQRPRDRHGMNVDHQRIARIQRHIQDAQNELLFTGDDIFTPDGHPLTNQEFAELLGAQRALLGE